MFVTKALAGLALALCTALPLHAATYNVAFDQSSNGAGDDWFGSFTAPEGGGTVSSARMLVNGLIFDEMIYNVYEAAVATYFAAEGTLHGVSYILAIFTPDPAGITQPVVFMRSVTPSERVWGTGTCYASNACAYTPLGTYRITAAVPLPAGLPLLAGGLGILALLRRRRV